MERMEKIIKFDNIKILRIEITDHCNARCPGCSRSNLDIFQHMSMQTWKNLVSNNNLSNIKRLYFNGNYGDFIVHPNSIDFLDAIPKKEIEIVISTNGGTKSLTYWNDLSNILKKFSNHLVIFGIDGTTDDIHQLHRRNVPLDKVLANAKTFIDNGGNASWQFVTFRHNLYEISKAYITAFRLGFKEFFLHNSYVSSITGTDNFQLESLDSEEFAKLYKTYYFSFHTLEGISDRYDKLNSICPWVGLKRVQINSDGTVWPCCWTADVAINPLELDLTSNIPNINACDLKDVIESSFFQEIITSKIHQKNGYCDTACRGKNSGSIQKVWFFKPNTIATDSG